MADEVRALGGSLLGISIAWVWIAVLLRAPSACRLSRERGLWLALATAGAAMTFSARPVADAVDCLTGLGALMALAVNLLGILSAAAVLDFIAVAKDACRFRIALWAATACVVAVMILLDATAPPHGGHTVPAAGPPVPSLAYWLPLIGAHLVADIACVHVCVVAARRRQSRAVATSFWLFGLGTACTACYWILSALYLPVRHAWIPLAQPLLMALHGLLRSAAVVIPVILVLLRTGRDASVNWRLWPLWRDLVDAVPHVALAGPQSRVRELFLPRNPRPLLAYRKVVEIRDALLVLGDHWSVARLQEARDYARAAGVPAGDADAVALACLLRAVCHGERAKAGLVASGAFVTGIGGETLAADTTFLLSVARAYQTPLVGCFALRPEVSPSICLADKRV